jgi:hypothetical protein
MYAHRAMLVVFCLLVLSLTLIQAQEKQVSERAAALNNSLAELQKKPSDPVVQQRYLEVFPRDYKSFLELFDLHRELYDGVDFIRILPELAKNHDAEVGNLLVRLSKDAHWEGDAPSYLQLATATYAGQHTKTFVSVIDQLSPSEQGNLITFLADVQNHSAYGEYQAIIDHLRSLGKCGLAQRFEEARKRRSQQPHG